MCRQGVPLCGTLAPPRVQVFVAEHMRYDPKRVTAPEVLAAPRFSVAGYVSAVQPMCLTAHLDVAPLRPHRWHRLPPRVRRQTKRSCVYRLLRCLPHRCCTACPFSVIHPLLRPFSWFCFCLLLMLKFAMSLLHMHVIQYACDTIPAGYARC